MAETRKTVLGDNSGKVVEVRDRDGEVDYEVRGLDDEGTSYLFRRNSKESAVALYDLINFTRHGA